MYLTRYLQLRCTQTSFAADDAWLAMGPCLDDSDMEQSCTFSVDDGCCAGPRRLLQDLSPAAQQAQRAVDTSARGQCNEAAAALVQADALLGASPGPHLAPFASLYCLLVEHG